MINRSCRSSWSRRLLSLSSLLLTLLMVETVQAETDFYRDVYPILKANCLACHNKKTTEGSLNLETPESAVAGGDSGPGIIPRKSAESYIYEAATQKGDTVMPPKNNKMDAKPLTDRELAILAAWIDEGAKTSVQKAQEVKWQQVAAAVHPVYCVDMTGEGRWGVAGRANQLYLYDLATRSLSNTLVDSAIQSKVPGNSPTAHLGLIHSVKFSPDGERIASGSYREVKIWQRATTGQPQLIASPIPAVKASVLNANGERMACLDAQGVLKIIKTSDGTVVTTIPDVKPAGVPQLRISPDGKQIAALQEKSIIRRWLLETGAPLSAITVPSEPRTAIWTAESASMLTAGADGMVRVWTVPAVAGQDVKLQREFQTPANPATLLIAPALADRLVIVSEDGQVRLWQISNGKMVSEFKTPPSLVQTISTDGAKLATCGADGVVHLWDLKTGKSLLELKKTLDSERKIAQLSQLLASHQLDVTFHQSEVNTFTATNKRLDEVVKKAESTIQTVKKDLPAKEKAAAETKAAQEQAQKAFDALAPQIAAAAGKPSAELEKQSKDLEKKLKDATDKAATDQGILQKAQNHLNDATADLERAKAGIARNTKTIETETALQTAAQAAVKQSTADLEAAKGTAAAVTAKPVACHFSADSRIVAVILDNGEFRAWGVASGDPIAQRAGDHATSTAQWISPASRTLTALLADGTRLTCDFTPTWTLERTLGGSGTDSPLMDRVNALDFSPDGQLLAVGGGIPSRGGDISIWNVASGNLVQKWDEIHTDSVLSLDFNGDGSRLASGGADRLARVTNVSTGKQEARLEGHTHHVLGLAFRTDDRILATAGADGSVLVWDLSNGERRNKIGGWTKEVTSIEYAGSSAQLITGSGDPLVRIVNDTGGQVRSISKLSTFVQAIAVSDSGDRIFGGEDNGTVHLWNAADGAELATFQP